MNPRNLFAELTRRNAAVDRRGERSGGRYAPGLLGIPELARYLVQPVVYRLALGAFLFAWQHDVRYLQGWHLTGQREHLVHSDPGRDRCITQAGLANLL